MNNSIVTKIKNNVHVQVDTVYYTDSNFTQIWQLNFSEEVHRACVTTRDKVDKETEILTVVCLTISRSTGGS